MKEYPEEGITYENMELIVKASAMHDIGKIGHELTGLQRAGIHHLPAEPHNGDDGAVNDEHHDGHIDDHHAKGLLGNLFQALIALGKFLPFVVLTDE